jgi:cysteine desulfurase
VNSIFLDNNATTLPLPEVQQAMLFAMNEGFGNASSAHRGGEAARRLVAHSRDCVAELIGANSTQIVFTSGATESNNWCVASGMTEPGIDRLALTEAEHSSIKQIAECSVELVEKVVLIPVDSSGLIDINRLAAICAKTTCLVSTHWVNNETGVVQPIGDVASICAEYGCMFHVDASQAVGKLNVQFAESGIDFMTIAAHKFHGPQGVGAIC